MESCRDYAVDWVHQEERRGTGHAVMQAMPGVPDNAAVLVLLGDTPLIPRELLAEMIETYRGPLALLTMELEDPHGYGRVLRDPGGNIIGVVEHRDADSYQHSIREVNTGIIMADAERLRGWLDRIGCDNAKKEYYLPDIFALARSEMGEIQGVIAPDADDLLGANDRRQLAMLGDILGSLPGRADRRRGEGRRPPGQPGRAPPKIRRDSLRVGEPFHGDPAPAGG